MQVVYSFGFGVCRFLVVMNRRGQACLVLWKVDRFITFCPCCVSCFSREMETLERVMNERRIETLYWCNSSLSPLGSLEEIQELHQLVAG